MARRSKKDIAFVYGVTGDRKGLRILRFCADGHGVHVGLLQPLREGMPIVGEVLRLTRRKDAPMFYDVEVAVAAGDTCEPSRTGPTRVTTDQYRNGWEAVWGRGRPLLN